MTAHWIEWSYHSELMWERLLKKWIWMMRQAGLVEALQ
jgi:hypothetical protein